MDPQISGFLVGLIFGAAKVGFIGTIGFALAWWNLRRKYQRLERQLPEPGQIEERLANLEQTTDFIGARLADLVDTQAQLVRQLNEAAERGRLPAGGREAPGELETPPTPH